MDTNNVEKRFVFTGKAVALGGRIRRNGDQPVDGDAGLIDGQASSCLPITGGRSVGSSENKSFHNGAIQFAKASSQTDGDYEQPAEAFRYTHGNYGENELGTATKVACSVHSLKIRVPGDGTERRFEAEELTASLNTNCARKSKAQVSVAYPVFRGITVV